jgi:hypothetical protein
MLQKIPIAFWKQHSSTMYEVLTLQGGDNEGTFGVYSY